MKILQLVAGLVAGFVSGFLVTAHGWVRIPGTYQENYYLWATVAIFAAGAWGFSTWRHQEKLREAREIPGIEMEIQFSESTLATGKVLLTIDVVVMNTSVLPIRPSIKEVTLSVGRIDPPSTIDFFPAAKSDIYQSKRYIGAHWDELTLEPRTKTVFSEFFLADPGSLYVVFFRMPAQSDGRGGNPWFWDKRRIHHVGSGKKTQSA